MASTRHPFSKTLRTPTRLLACRRRHRGPDVAGAAPRSWTANRPVLQSLDREPLGGTHEAARVGRRACDRQPVVRPGPVPADANRDVSDTYFGLAYKDPYRWLEDLKDQAVQGWFKSQAALTDDQLAKIRARDALAEEWLKLDKLQPAKYNTILFESGRVFYKKTLGGENVGKLYYRDGWRGAEKLLFDPSTFKPKGAKDGDVTTIQGIAASPDGRLVALGFSAAGAEYSEIKIIDVAKHELLPESWYPSTVPIGGPWTRNRCSTTWARSTTSRAPRSSSTARPRSTGWARRSRPTSTSSRTKPIPTSESRPRSSRRRSSTSPIPTT